MDSLDLLARSVLVLAACLVVPAFVALIRFLRVPGCVDWPTAGAGNSLMISFPRSWEMMASVFPLALML